MSNALESASLIMYPSGYSDGVLGSLKPTDGSGDFTFTRGSNLSATRVGPNGYIEKGYENLLLQSNSFDTTWIRTNATISGGEQGYDGSSDAWLLTGLFGSHALTQNISNSGVATYSLYAKAGTGSGIRIRAIGSTTYTMFVTLTDGTIFSNDGIDGKVIDAGNGWYKYEFTFNTSLTSIQMRITNGATDDFAGTIYIQDAMLNQGLVAYPYIETTTAPVAGGILEDEPRIDFSDGCGHLLLEPSRTNLFEHSEYYGGFAFTNSSIETNSITSPEGLQNASSLIDTTSNVAHRLRTQYFTATSGSTYTASLFIKKGSVDFLQLTFSSGQFGSNYAWFNLTNYSIDSVTSGASATIEVFGNDWYKLTYTITAVAGGISYFFINPSDSTSSIFYTGSNSANLHLYGLQLEQDATYPTSYIPTYGSSSTRLVDNASLSSIDTLTNDYTIFLNIVRTNDNDDNLNFMRMGDSATDSEILFITRNTGRFRVRIEDDSANSANIYSSNNVFLQGDVSKVAIKSTGNGFYFFINGVLDNSTTSVGNTTLSEITYLKENVNVNEMILFPTALSDDECIALTS